MTLEDALTTYLLTQTSITAYTSDIFFIDSMQDLQTDYIRFYVTGPRNDMMGFGDRTRAQPVVQLDVFSTSEVNALAICNAIFVALHGYQGTLATGLTVVTSSASGPMVIRDTSAQEWNGWYHGIVNWNVEYIR